MELEKNEKEYILKYDINRVRMIENTLKKPLFQMVRSGGFSVNELIVLVGYGLMEKDTYKRMQPKDGIKFAEQLLERKGSYLQLSEMVADAIENDCGFFFPED